MPITTPSSTSQSVFLESLGITIGSFGPGAEMRYAMGIAVFFGMLGVTVFGLFLTPVFYVVLRALNGRPLHTAHPHAAPMPAGAGD